MQPIDQLFAGSTDAMGAFDSGVLRPVPTLWAAVKVVAQTTGNAEWAIVVGGTAKAFGRGPRVDIPILLQPSQSVEVQLLGAQAGKQVNGVITGLGAATLAEIAPYISLVPNTIAVEATSPPAELGQVVASSGSPTTSVFSLPAGIETVAYRTTQTAGGVLTGSATLVITDGAANPTLFADQAPVILNQWAWARVVALPTGQVAVTLDMTAVVGVGGQYTTELVALPWTAAIGVQSDPGGAVAVNLLSPVPWQIVNVSAGIGVAAIAAGGTLTVIPAGGATVRTRLRRVAFSINAAATTFGAVECPPGTVRGQWDGTVSRDYEFDWDWQDCGLNSAVLLRNSGSNPTGNINGYATASQL